MQNRSIRVVILSLGIVLVAAGCTNAPPTINHVKVKLAGTSATPSLTNATNRATTAPGEIALPSGWSTFTNPQGLYQISYPDSIGSLIVEYTTKGATLGWSGLDGTFDVTIGEAYNPQSLTLEAWLVERYPTTASKETIYINGMNGVILTDAYSGDRVYLARDINGFLYIYEIDFNCYGGEQQCTPPPFWRQMLDSFDPLPANS